MTNLGTFGGTYGNALGVSANGAVVVGYSYLTGDTAAAPCLPLERRRGRPIFGTLGGTSSAGIAVCGRWLSRGRKLADHRRHGAAGLPLEGGHRHAIDLVAADRLRRQHHGLDTQFGKRRLRGRHGDPRHRHQSLGKHRSLDHAMLARLRLAVVRHRCRARSPASPRSGRLRRLRSVLRSAP